MRQVRESKLTLVQSLHLHPGNGTKVPVDMLTLLVEGQVGQE